MWPVRRRHVRMCRATLSSMPGGMRVSQLLARVGLCSRRQGDVFIANKRVKINGVVVTSPATLVQDRDGTKARHRIHETKY